MSFLKLLLNKILEALKENSISVNKIKVNEDYIIDNKDLISNKYIILNKGKKNTYIIKVI